MARFARTVVAVTMAAASAAAIGACGGKSPDGVDERALGLTGHPIVQPQEVAARTAAEELLVKRCMERAGFQYPAAGFGEVLDEQRRARSQPYGFASRQAVALAVRHDRSLAEEGASILAKDRYKASLSARRLAAYQTAYYGPAGPQNAAQIKLPDGSSMGIVTGGCHGQALRALYGDIAQWTRLEATADYVRIRTVKQTIDTPEFKRAAAAYVACARRRGISGKTPFAAAARGKNRSSAAQDQLIESIWSCQREARVTEVGKEAEVGQARQETADHERDVLAYREQSRRALLKAQKVLASAS